MTRRRARAKRRRTSHQRELLESLDIFRGIGIGGVALGALIGIAGGSATLAWTIGMIGAASLGFSLLLPLVARRKGVTWGLAAVAISVAFTGGIAYLLVPSDATWWLGQLAFLPAAAIALYFGRARESDGHRHDGTSEGMWDAPSGGGDAGGG